MPEITEHTVNKRTDEFFVACSDGVWGVMSSQECVDIIAASTERQPGKKLNGFLAAQEVIAESARRWKDEEGDYRDDITAVVISLPCFEPPPAVSSPRGTPRTPVSRSTSSAGTTPSASPLSVKTPAGGPGVRKGSGLSPRTPTSGGGWGKKLMGGGRNKKDASPAATTTPGTDSIDRSTTPGKAAKGKGTTLRRIVSVKETDLAAPSGSKM